MIVYEQPLHERVRLFLRLNALFLRFDQYLEHQDEAGDHAALDVLVDLYALLQRVDLKRELMGEIERQTSNLVRLRDDPSVDAERLSKTLDDQRILHDKLEAQSGSPDSEVRGDEFYNAVRQRSSVPGGACDFDLPVYHAWRSQPIENRHALLMHWIRPLQSIREACRLVVAYIRASGQPKTCVAIDGYYEQTLDQQVSWQLLRIGVDETTCVYPEISAGRQRFTLRFYDPGDFRNRPRAATENLEFILTCCAL